MQFYELKQYQLKYAIEYLIKIRLKKKKFLPTLFVKNLPSSIHCSEMIFSDHL